MSTTVPREAVEDILVRALASLVLAEKSKHENTATVMRHVVAALACSLNLEPEDLVPYLDRAGKQLELAMEMSLSGHTATETIQ